MRFLIDAQLPPALARWLLDRGYDAKHVYDCFPDSTTDTEIWNYALQNNIVIISKDQDFAHRLTSTQGTSPSVVWLRVGNTSKRALLAWLTAIWPKIDRALSSGEQLIEVV